jgi:hypothetical protein
MPKCSAMRGRKEIYRYFTSSNLSISSDLELARTAYLRAKEKNNIALAEQIWRHASNLKCKTKSFSYTCVNCGRAPNKRYGIMVFDVYVPEAFCFRKRCMRKGKQKEAAREKIERIILELNELCPFLEYQGFCALPAANGRFCSDHACERCVNCGHQATTHCFHVTSWGVCGQPLCGKTKDHLCHRHQRELARKKR